VSDLAHCDEGHLSGEHAAECGCVCCAETLFADDSPAVFIPLPAKGSVYTLADTITGLLLPVDIFRPPAAA
jgi:hypothetical protein